MRESSHNRITKIIGHAIAKTRQPNTIPRESGAGRGAMATHEDSATYPSEDGYTIHDFFVDIDSLDDPLAALT